MLACRALLAAASAGLALSATRARADVPDEAPRPSPLDLTLEVLRLKDAMARELPRGLMVQPARPAELLREVRAALAAANAAIERPQLLVAVDRNPRVQLLSVVLATPGAVEDWRVLGGARVSTGSTGRFDHYLTPLGAFGHTAAILGFRAEGTPNENGIRGLGAKGMRVWDFGWQVAPKGWDAGPGKPDTTPIRLMMHATDPDKLEQRIGRPASQGCVRVPSALNRFLDRHGVIDADYERVAPTDIRFRTLLGPDRQPTPLAGTLLVVVDSTAPKPSALVAGAAPPARMP